MEKELLPLSILNRYWSMSDVMSFELDALAPEDFEDEEILRNISDKARSLYEALDEYRCSRIMDKDIGEWKSAVWYDKVSEIKFYKKRYKEYKSDFLKRVLIESEVVDEEEIYELYYSEVEEMDEPESFEEWISYNAGELLNDSNFHYFNEDIYFRVIDLEASETGEFKVPLEHEILSNGNLKLTYSISYEVEIIQDIINFIWDSVKNNLKFN